ncbi:MAG: alternative ribosome rescue aminoacyl-tRNA hydrolase ArfB [Prolixibacteraceae bacterium]|nr:alternative ribosome rescue aminoacyl-tRNA hydrolase ArfB [Prolixibacteraceae bacterium]
MALSDSTIEKLLGETELIAVRSSGPGGQNVNKVSTKAELRFSVNNSKYLTDKEKQRIFSKLKNRINNSGELVLTSQSERTQRGNRQKVLARFTELLDAALTPSKKRIKTKPTHASKLKRLEKKKKRSEIKQLRKWSN